MITKTGAMLKEAITPGRLRDVIERVVKPKIVEFDPSNSVSSQTLKRGVFALDRFPLERLKRFLLENKDPENWSKLLPYNTRGKKIDRYGAKSAVRSFEKVKPEDYGKIYLNEDFSSDWLSDSIGIPRLSGKLIPVGKKKGIFGRLGLKEYGSNKGITEDLILKHEYDELVAGKKALKQMRKNKDTFLPTGHNHPDVLFKEHNVITSMDIPKEHKDELVQHMTNFRRNAGDLHNINRTLGRLGEYGTGMKINRSMRKHLANKLIAESRKQYGLV